MSNFGRNLALWVVIALLLVVLFNLFQPNPAARNNTPRAYSDFIADVNAGKVRDVLIQGRVITGRAAIGPMNEERNFQTYAPEDPSLV